MVAGESRIFFRLVRGGFPGSPFALLLPSPARARRLLKPPPPPALPLLLVLVVKPPASVVPALMCCSSVIIIVADGGGGSEKVRTGLDTSSGAAGVGTTCITVEADDNTEPVLPERRTGEAWRSLASVVVVAVAARVEALVNALALPWLLALAFVLAPVFALRLEVAPVLDPLGFRCLPARAET